MASLLFLISEIMLVAGVHMPPELHTLKANVSHAEKEPRHEAQEAHYAAIIDDRGRPKIVHEDADSLLSRGSGTGAEGKGGKGGKGSSHHKAAHAPPPKLTTTKQPTTNTKKATTTQKLTTTKKPTTTTKKATESKKNNKKKKQNCGMLCKPGDFMPDVHAVNDSGTKYKCKHIQKKMDKTGKDELSDCTWLKYRFEPICCNGTAKPPKELLCGGKQCSDCDVFTGKCKKCKKGTCKSMSGECLEECPPGFTQDVNSLGHCKCTRCQGEANRTDNTCTACSGGHISKPDSDGCQNIQDTCTHNQCRPCADCMDGVSKTLKQCMQSSGTSCLDPGGSWCAGTMEKLMQCQSLSFGCYYKLLCSSACVCSTWKDIFCGNVTGNEGNQGCSSLLQLGGMSIDPNSASLKAMALERRTQGNTSNDGGSSETLDFSMRDKCPGN